MSGDVHFEPLFTPAIVATSERSTLQPVFERTTFTATTTVNVASTTTATDTEMIEAFSFPDEVTPSSESQSALACLNLTENQLHGPSRNSFLDHKRCGFYEFLLMLSVMTNILLAVMPLFYGAMKRVRHEAVLVEKNVVKDIEKVEKADEVEIKVENETMKETEQAVISIVAEAEKEEENTDLKDI